jgi:hypothetical protein
MNCVWRHHFLCSRFSSPQRLFRFVSTSISGNLRKVNTNDEILCFIALLLSVCGNDYELRIQNSYSRFVIRDQFVTLWNLLKSIDTLFVNLFSFSYRGNWYGSVLQPSRDKSRNKTSRKRTVFQAIMDRGVYVLLCCCNLVHVSFIFRS